jgi:UDP-N-acetylglucosamine 2-epimerase
MAVYIAVIISTRPEIKKAAFIRAAFQNHIKAILFAYHNFCVHVFFGSAQF